MIYWIEVKFSNGKTLRKESTSINDTYTVFVRYSNSRKPAVQEITSGYGDTTTGSWNLMSGIAV